jgi:Ca2+-binding EF-hand superfamily protein
MRALPQQSAYSKTASISKRNMGAEVGKPISNLGITAIASVTPAIEQNQILALKTELQKVSTAKGSEFIVKAELDDALKKSGKFDAADLDIFAKLFILFDGGDATINYKDYVAGIAACLTSTVLKDKLLFVCSIFDVEATNTISKPQLKRVLVSINSVASYFGDPVLTLNDLDQIVQETSDNTAGKGKSMTIDAAVDYIITHPLVQVFLMGEGKVRFGAGELVPVAP